MFLTSGDLFELKRKHQQRLQHKGSLAKLVRRLLRAINQWAGYDSETFIKMEVDRDILQREYNSLSCRFEKNKRKLEAKNKRYRR